MKKILSIVVRALMLTVFFGTAKPAFAYDSYQSFRSRPISLNVDFQYYKTEANFNADGAKASLLSGHTFQNMNLNPKVRWQFGSDLALIGGFNYGNTESNDNAFSRKSALINRIDMGAEYLFSSDVWMKIFGRLSYAHPLEKIDFGGDAVLTSNGASEIHSEVIVNFDFEGGIYTFLKGGVNIRGEGLSTLGTYGVGSELRFSSFGIGASVLGQLTVKEDDNTQRSSYRDNLNNRVDAGSKIFNALNPNSHDLELNLNFLMNHQSKIKVYAGTTLIGSNTSEGIYIGTTINWVFDYTPAISVPSKIPPVRRKDNEVLFKEKTDDGVNQDYFKPVTPLKSEYIQQIEGSKQNLEKTTEPDPDEMIQTKKVPTKTKGYKIKLRKVKTN
ncbi:MAG: hypothetical protein H7235_03325 [Bdellovibrionaceae bacterium]|nr:hypothetical protein [Pseudobdellovibrionaceae bacterium]